LPANTLLAPGNHLIAFEVEGSGAATGVTANAWAYRIPEPSARQDLAGTWSITGADGIHDVGQAALPGSFTGLLAARDVVIDAGHSGSAVVLYVQRTGACLNGIMINGAFIGDIYPAAKVGDTLLVNITTKVAFGQTNRIELLSSGPTGPAAIPTIEIRYYDPTVYP